MKTYTEPDKRIYVSTNKTEGFVKLWLAIREIPEPKITMLTEDL